MNDDNTIVPFKPRLVPAEVTPSDPKAPDQAIVGVLERFLADAKEGKVRFVGIAYVDDKGVASSTWEPAGEETNAQLVTQALGAVSYLNFRFSQAAEDGSVYTED